MRVCDYIAKFLKNSGFRVVFGFQGGAVTPLIDSIAVEGIQYIQGYHEQASGFMADAYARVNNKCSIAMATNGPGATNLVSAIANAYLDSIPVLFITGQVNTSDIKQENIRQNGFQEVDTIGMVKHITKYAKLVTNENKVLYELKKALYIAQEGRKGSVLLDFPLNILMGEIDESKQVDFVPPVENKNEFDLDKIVDLISLSKRPVIVAGGGIRQADAENELKEFVSKTNIPVCNTLAGLDVYTSNTIGFSGLYGQTYSNLAIYNSDLVIVLGTRLSKRQFGKTIENYSPKAKFIHVDVDKNELGHVVNADVGICANLKTFLSEINKKDLPVFSGEWGFKIDLWKEKYKTDVLQNEGLDPVVVVSKISEIADKNSFITTDVGQNQMWTAQGWELKDGQRIFSSAGLGCMGFSLPAAIGAYFANPNRTVIAFMGDGGLQMNIQELQTIKNYKIPIKIVVFNNNSLGMIQESQYKYMGSRYVGTKDGYGCPDIKKLATAYDLEYFKEENIVDFMKSNNPSVLEVVLNQNPTRLLIKYDRSSVYEEEKLW